MRFLLLCSIFLMGCSHHNHDNSPKESNVEIVEELKGNRWDNIYFSKQPSQTEMKKLKKAGFATVVNLRQKVEKDYKESWESEIVKTEGLNYYNIPTS